MDTQLILQILSTLTIKQQAQYMHKFMHMNHPFFSVTLVVVVTNDYTREQRVEFVNEMENLELEQEEIQKLDDMAAEETFH